MMALHFFDEPDGKGVERKYDVPLWLQEMRERRDDPLAAVLDRYKFVRWPFNQTFKTVLKRDHPLLSWWHRNPSMTSRQRVLLLGVKLMAPMFWSSLFVLMLPRWLAQGEGRVVLEMAAWVKREKRG